MEVDTKIKKIMKEYELRGDDARAKMSLSGLFGKVVVESKRNRISPLELQKIEKTYCIMFNKKRM